MISLLKKRTCLPGLPLDNPGIHLSAGFSWKRYDLVYFLGKSVTDARISVSRSFNV